MLRERISAIKYNYLNDIHKNVICVSLNPFGMDDQLFQHVILSKENAGLL